MLRQVIRPLRLSYEVQTCIKTDPLVCKDEPLAEPSGRRGGGWGEYRQSKRAQTFNQPSSTSSSFASRALGIDSNRPYILDTSSKIIHFRGICSDLPFVHSTYLKFERNSLTPSEMTHGSDRDRRWRRRPRAPHHSVGWIGIQLN